MNPLSSSCTPKLSEPESAANAQTSTPDLRAFQELGLFAVILGTYFYIQDRMGLSAEHGNAFMLAPSLFLLTVSGLYAFTKCPMTLHSQLEFRVTVVLFSLVSLFLMAILMPAGPDPYLLHMLFLVPIAEEAFFRGILLDHLVRYNGKNLALVLSSILFALLHFNQGSFGQMLLLGLLLGIVTVRTRRLVWAIVGHAAWNFAALIF